MRIVSGRHRGRRIEPPANFKARPTTDFAKENLFNVLNNIIDFEDIAVLDLFAGTGGISYEFISRGCSEVVIVEKESSHFRFIQKCLKELNEEKRALPLNMDVFKFINSTERKFDVIFADPPYDLEKIDTIPQTIFDRTLLKEDGILIFEHSDKYDFSQHPNFSQLRKYGSVHFSIFNAQIEEISED